MNHEYRSKYEQMQDNQPGKTDDKGERKLYTENGYSRNIAFILPTGDIEAFSYSYLIRLQYKPDEAAIVLTFTSFTVKMTGYDLRSLFLELFDQKARIIECIDERYKSLATKSVVTNISISQIK